MAIMHPNNLDNFDATKSERKMFENLRDQLDDNFHIFFSVTWYTILNGERKNSECDFLVFNPNYGYLAIEVKGGTKIEVKNNEWTLYSYNRDGEIESRKLNKSPYKQAESSMYYFNTYYRKETLTKFRGIYGMAVAFPFFSVNVDMENAAPKELTIDIHDMNKLNDKINSLFHYWKRQNRGAQSFLSQEQANKFINLVNRRIALSIAAGSLIPITNRKLENINIIQDATIALLENYNKAKIIGGAGTGKTWIAIKKIKQQAQLGKKCLYTCYSNKLVNYVNGFLMIDNVTCCSVEDLFQQYLYEEEINNLRVDANGDYLYSLILSEKNLDKYDCIMIDEAQDFSEDWANAVQLFIKENGVFYVFYDENQNIYGRNLKSEFLVNSPPYILINNIRNTRNIHQWVKNKTQIGEQVISNDVFGCDPETYDCINEQGIIITINSLLNKLILEEQVNNKTIVLLGDVSYEDSIFKRNEFIGDFKIIEEITKITDKSVLYQSVEDYKGLEANVIIYINTWNKSEPYNKNYYDRLYIAGTRAKYYLYIINLMY